MKFSYLHFFVFVTSAASQATLRHEISSKGPDVTISLSWDPAYCPEDNTPLYHVELSCSGSNTEWVDFGVGSATVTKFESSEKFPISFFREYRLRIFVHCTSFNPWHDVVIRTGPGELRPPRGVTVIGGNQTATITWLEPSNRDNMEIIVCDRTSKTSKNCTGALRSYSQTRKYVVERLTHGTPYTAMVSVSKNFMGKIYRSQPVSVDFATLPGEPTLRHEISSKGPDVTISLSWDPAYCPEDNSPLYHVELSSSGSDTEWVDFKEIRSATVTKFESSEKFPISFFREYRLRIFVRCTSFNLWHDVEIRTGPGELRPPRGVTVIGGSQTATITWLEPSNRDNMEIVVCYRTSKNCTGALRSYSQTRKCVVERLTQGTSYTAMVSVSKNFMGKIYRSQPVSVDFATLPGELPGPPSGITVLHERGRKIIQWDAEVNQRLLIAAYKVNATDLQSRKYTVLFTKIRRFELSTLKSNTRFELKISACMDTAGTRCGEPALLEISTMDIGYPSRPRVELVSRSGGRIIIRWSEPEEPFGPIDGYEIAYGLKGDSFSPSDWVSVGRSDRTKTFERLQTMTTYIFHVVAFNLDSRNRKLYSLPGILEVTIDK